LIDQRIQEHIVNTQFRPENNDKNNKQKLIN